MCVAHPYALPGPAWHEVIVLCELDAINVEQHLHQAQCHGVAQYGEVN